MEPLKRQQRKVDNEYTIMFIPHRGKEPKSFSFRASLLKKIGIFCGILLLAGIGIAAKSSMVVYQAHQEQNELIAYRNDKAAQDQKLAELQKENEKMQKDMAELSALENEVRKALGSNVSQQPSRGGIDRSQYMGNSLRADSPQAVVSFGVYRACACDRLCGLGLCNRYRCARGNECCI